jgi:hypothetical protein
MYIYTYICTMFSIIYTFIQMMRRREGQKTLLSFIAVEKWDNNLRNYQASSEKFFPTSNSAKLVPSAKHLGIYMDINICIDLQIYMY